MLSHYSYSCQPHTHQVCDMLYVFTPVADWCVCVCVPVSGDVLEKIRLLEGFSERMEVLSQHSNDTVREKARQISEKVSVNKT